MNKRIQKWGNSLAVRLPKKTADQLGLKEGSRVVIEKEKETITIKKPGTTSGTKTKSDWREFMIVSDARKKERVSERIDDIVYGTRR